MSASTASWAASADMPVRDTQRVGRMGELVVELELLKRGWQVGNFNATTLNNAGYDLFATRGARSVKIRVKAKRPGVECFRWSAKPDGSVFIGLIEDDDTDFVAAVSFEADGAYHAYILPTQAVFAALDGEYRRWIDGEKRGGQSRKPTSMRNIYMDRRVDGAPSRGFATRWAMYRDAWHGLDSERPPGLYRSREAASD